MSALLLHGIVSADHFGADEPLGHTDHIRARAGPLLGLATPATPKLLDQSDEVPLTEVQAHHRILTTYSRQGAVRPVRFGTVFSDGTALSQAIVAELEDHCAWLERLSGCAEYTLRLTSASDQPASDRKVLAGMPDTGRGFLVLKRASRDRRRDLSARRHAFAASLPDAFAQSAAAVMVLSQSQNNPWPPLAILVHKESTQGFLGVARTLADQASELAFKISLRGPGPCYTFAGDADGISHVHRAPGSIERCANHGS